MKIFLPIGIIIIVVIFFFRSFFLNGLLPIPADTIVGLYNPYRDFYAVEYPRGIPFKNFLITDSVRQQFPWRSLTISIEKNVQLPLWNPYSFSGTPLAANAQSAPYYPFNILFFVLPFSLAWSLLIFLQPILAGLFIYLYLRNVRVSKLGSLLGGLSFAFCGFMVAWMEWGTIAQTLLWLPILLLSIDKIFYQSEKVKNFKWPIIFSLSLIFSFFAGHLQTFFYVFIFSLCYVIFRFFQTKNKFSLLIILSSILIFLIVTSVEWIPLFQFILLSARNADMANWQQAGWFIPWQNLAQFVAPDFFGNPSTLNYFGVWNYGEFIGYIGMFPLIMVMFPLFYKRDRLTYFFTAAGVLSLLFALPTFLAFIPFQFHIPFISTSQPTRLLSIIDFSFCVLSAFGFDYFYKTKKLKIYPLIFIGFLFGILWFIVIFGTKIHIAPENIAVMKNNLYLPTALFIESCVFIICFFYAKNKKVEYLLLLVIFIFLVFDLLRFGDKFTPFTKNAYLFPNTSTISFLQTNLGNNRFMSLDSKILPPNFSDEYHIQSIEGYDPLYLQRYGELIIASQRGKPDISSPFGFNRIITPHNYKSPIINLLGVKYILSLSQLSDPNLKKVFQEGQTIIYENKNVFPRAFFVKKIELANGKQDSLNKMFAKSTDLKTEAIVENYYGLSNFSVGKVNISSYSENNVILQTSNSLNGFLVLSDTFYPTWHATIDNTSAKIYQTDYNFRGIIVPPGIHTIKFYDSLF